MIVFWIFLLLALTLGYWSCVLNMPYITIIGLKISEKVGCCSWA